MKGLQKSEVQINHEKEISRQYKEKNEKLLIQLFKKQQKNQYHIKSIRISKKWWDGKCRQETEIRNKLRNEAFRTRREEGRKAYQDQRRRVKKISSQKLTES